jgi:hydroxymethylglutaryl-CoA lyase
VLDLRTEYGRHQVIELVRRSDIVIENFRPGTLEKWGSVSTPPRCWPGFPAKCGGDGSMPDAATGGAQLRDVTLRDGLQLTHGMLDVDRKLEVIRLLRAVGIRELEIGSMARPDLVPSMANTVDVISELRDDELTDCWVWVCSPRQVERAAEAGARNFQYCLSASDAHNQANIGRSTEQSLVDMPAAAEIAADVAGRIQLCIATAFTCPFDGAVSPARVVAIANDHRTAAADDIVLCDTLGQAGPGEVSKLVSGIAHESPLRRIVFHGHDTWGMGTANTLAAIAAGARLVDGALGGLGGCPFAPGASGNTASEDILFAIRPTWLTPERLGTIAALSEALLSELDEPMRARTVHGMRSNATAFEWATAPPKKQPAVESSAARAGLDDGVGRVRGQQQ